MQECIFFSVGSFFFLVRLDCFDGITDLYIRFNFEVWVVGLEGGWRF